MSLVIKIINLSSIKDSFFMDQLYHREFFKKDSAAWSVCHFYLNCTRVVP